jgi:hypothetical protein
MAHVGSMCRTLRSVNVFHRLESQQESFSQGLYLVLGTGLWRRNGKGTLMMRYAACLDD